MERKATLPNTTQRSRSISVLVPALNEVRNLGTAIERLLRALAVTADEFEIIVVDDGSTDGTSDLADRLAGQHPQVRVIHNGRNMGLGYSYRRGIDAAEKEYFAYIPGDNSWPYRSLLELFEHLGQADIVTSYATNPEVRGITRRFISTQYTRTLNRLFGHGMRYYNGLTIYPLAFLQLNPPISYHFGFQAELVLRAIDQGLSILEIGLPIDEHALQRSKAVTVKNVVSVMATVAGMYAELRLLPRLQGQSKPSRRWRDAKLALELSTTRALEAGAAATQTNGHRAGPRLRVIVAGASSGIGAALVESLCADGHEVFACARRADRLEEVTRAHALAHSRVCDVADEAQVQAFLAWVQSQSRYVDAVVNCAGGFGAIGPLETTDSEEWWQTIRVNLLGTYLMTKHALPLLRGSPDPRVVNFSGGGAFDPFPNYSAYACSKAAVVRLTECLAAECAPQGIAVNALAPGFLPTEIHWATLVVGPERAGEAHYEQTMSGLKTDGSRMATAIACLRFLLSPESRGLTGKTVSANFDPWRTKGFAQSIAEINGSEIWTMRRMNIDNLADSDLKVTLGKAQASKATSDLEPTPPGR
jgi:3-oxoacyl-[acyl-carrier protein] reductase